MSDTWHLSYYFKQHIIAIVFIKHRRSGKYLTTKRMNGMDWQLCFVPDFNRNYWLKYFNHLITKIPHKIFPESFWYNESVRNHDSSYVSHVTLCLVGNFLLGSWGSRGNYDRDILLKIPILTSFMMYMKC